MDGFRRETGNVRRCLGAGIAAALMAGAAVADDIDTWSSWNKTSGNSYWNTSAATQGQTITPDGSQTLLSQFTFYAMATEATPVQYKGLVYAWDVATRLPVGAPLFESGVLDAPTTLGVYEPLTVEIGALPLTEGQSYVLAVSRVAASDQTIGQHRLGFVLNSAGNNLYPGGSFVFSTATDLAGVESTTWYASANVELALIALFAQPPLAVPAVRSAVDSVGSGIANGAADVIDASPALQAAFAGLPDDRSVASAAVSTLPVVEGGSSMATGEALTQVNQTVQARLQSLRGLSGGDEAMADRRLWFKPFVSRARQGMRSGASGFHADSHGFVIGADDTFGERTRLGLAFAYARADVDGGLNMAHSLDIDLHQLIGYAALNVTPDVEATAQIDFGSNSNDSRRVVFGNVASAGYDSLTTHAGASVARIFEYGPLRIAPAVRADYTRVRDSAYAETGAGVFNLVVDGENSEEFVVGADLRMIHDYSASTRVDTSIGVGYDVINERASLTAAYAGAPGASFATRGIAPSPWQGRAGIGITRVLDSGVELQAHYDAEFRSDFLSQTASLKARWPF